MSFTEAIRQMQAARAQRAQANIYGVGARLGEGFSRPPILPLSPTQTVPITLEPLKKSLKEIEAEPFDGEARKRIESKIVRLQKVGAISQALTLEIELQTRDSILRLKEWDYKILPQIAIKDFEAEHHNWDGIGGHAVIHIDPLEKYCGNPQVGEAKDRIMPDEILEKLEEAKERELFDEFAILWAERVKDPLLLGIVNGCEDYFFIAEWGDDITFEQIMEGKD